ncbi:hypothetical protein DENSPDRAFT_65543 [Dentipellis sp. KUC8613]|nr:hypothetical protein DENSPDRAFT_65543 [Dentipellis sp. KUC8613]
MRECQCSVSRLWAVNCPVPAPVPCDTDQSRELLDVELGTWNVEVLYRSLDGGFSGTGGGWASNCNASTPRACRVRARACRPVWVGRASALGGGHKPGRKHEREQGSSAQSFEKVASPELTLRVRCAASSADPDATSGFLVLALVVCHAASRSGSGRPCSSSGSVQRVRPTRACAATRDRRRNVDVVARRIALGVQRVIGLELGLRKVNFALTPSIEAWRAGL